MAAEKSERLESTRLRTFCDRICQGHVRQLESRQIAWSLDVDAELHACVPQKCVTQILNWCIADALDAMEQGGHLDLTVVPVEGGIEIEIADSRETFPSRASVRLLQHEGMRIDAIRCPQGGWARTVFIPDSAAAQEPNSGSTPQYGWRRAA